MKKLISFLRSMRFGIILLILVMACSLAGSLVPQDRIASWYIENYSENLGNLVVGLGMHRLFSTWYFILLISLLGLNLLLCTLIRFGSIRKTKASTIRSTENLTNGRVINREASLELRNWFANRPFRRKESDDVVTFSKNTSGFYGSFIVHLSLLLILAFGGIVLDSSTISDYQINPLETLRLDDGTLLTLTSFRIVDDAGRTEYASIIDITSPDGFTSSQREIMVNHPYTFRSNKYYQFNYGVCGSITTINALTGGWDVFYLSERSFLSEDNRTGIWYEALFPAYVLDEHGHISPLVMQTMSYPDPVYYVLISDETNREAKFMFPGDSVQIGEIEFIFNAPAYYSGIRVKRVPHPFLELLYVSFMLMVFGFWLCFFHRPVIVAIGLESYKVGGLDDGVPLEIEAFLSDIKETHIQC